MGSYLVPGARSLDELETFATPAPGSTLELVDGGVLIQGSQSDAELAVLYAGFVPTGQDDAAWRQLLPPSLREHAAHLRDLEQAIRNGQAVSNAQTLHVLADIIRWIRLTEPRL